MVSKKNGSNGDDRPAIIRNEPERPNKDGHPDRADQLPELVSKIGTRQEEYSGLFKKALPLAIEIGGYLLECFEIVGWGRWGKWLKGNLPGLHEKTAQRYMKVARYKDFVESISDNLSELSIAQATALIGRHIHNESVTYRAKAQKKHNKLATDDPTEFLLSNLSTHQRKAAEKYIERDHHPQPWEIETRDFNAAFLGLPAEVQCLVNSYTRLLEIKGQEFIDCLWQFMWQRAGFREMAKKMEDQLAALNASTEEVAKTDGDATMH